MISTQLDAIHVMDTLTNQLSTIRLYRTLRVLEDGNVHNIPATFGPFPLIDISKCAADNVPDIMKKKRGLMVSMLQREAMCIKFSSPSIWKYKSAGSTNCHFAVRAYAGGVNVITGRKSTETQAEE